MSGFYRRPAKGSPISQGDIFDDVPVIGAAFEPLHELIVEQAALRVERADVGSLRDGAQLVEQVALKRAVVISQSCDALRSRRLVLALLSPFVVQGKDADKQWQHVSRAATSLAETRSVYLPGNPTLGLERSLADFGEAFTLPRELLEELDRRGRRRARLSGRSLAYFQFRLTVMLTRVAQDDYAWPSADDLALKIGYLDKGIAAQLRRVAGAESALRAAGPNDDRLDLEEELREQQQELAELRRERDEAEAASRTADDLEPGPGE